MSWIAIKDKLPPHNRYVLVATETTLVGIVFTNNSDVTFSQGLGHCNEVMLYGDTREFCRSPHDIAYWMHLGDLPLPTCANCDKSCLHCHISHLKKDAI